MTVRAEPRLAELDDVRDRCAAAVAEAGGMAVGPLTEYLFLSVHCGITDEGHGERAVLAGILDAARLALADLPSRIGGWRRIVSRSEAGVVLEAADGAMVRLPPGMRPSQYPDGADGWLVSAPVISAPLDGRWVYWSSSADRQDRYSVRLYLNLRPDLATANWLRVVRAVAATGIACQSKISTRLRLRRRLDGVVLYLPDVAAARVVVDLIAATVPAGELGPPSAGFACPLAPGIALATRDAAPARSDFDTSWGYWWAARLARAWLQENRQTTVDAELEQLRLGWARIWQQWRHDR